MNKNTNIKQEKEITRTIKNTIKRNKHTDNEQIRQWDMQPTKHAKHAENDEHDIGHACVTCRDWKTKSN